MSDSRQDKRGRGARGSRSGTATSRFGVGRREAHDSRDFYVRFHPPAISQDAQLAAPSAAPANLLVCGDARRMDELADRSVALVVTSPPYFVGKEYEEAVGQGHVPASYLEYLKLLRDVFACCRDKLEPGGRIAVNVANLGRKPYRSLSADVIRILQDDLQLLLRGEVIWRKAEGATGSCAWGSFRSPVNPVLRDLSERVIIASKGRFDRARKPAERRAAGLPHAGTLTADEFMAATLDIWDIPPESARRVGHPAPFPVELPLRLIELYTFAGDLVLDPFLGSGTTAVAALRSGRRYAGYDMDPTYVELARRRLVAEGEPAGQPPRQLLLAGLEEPAPARARSVEETGAGAEGPAVRAAAPGPDDEGAGAGAGEGEGRAAPQPRAGGTALDIAARLLERCGFTLLDRNRRTKLPGLAVSLVAADRQGQPWYFDVPAAFTTSPAGLQRMDAVWRFLGRAQLLARQGIRPLVLLTSHLPVPRSPGDRALHAAGPETFFDALEILDLAGQERLRRYAAGGCRDRAVGGFWRR